MLNTTLTIHSTLPLTCSRTGACCFGNLVRLNPWELQVLAREKKLSPKEFRDIYCDLGGIRLLFNGNAGWQNKQACSQYVDKFGCSVHTARPLACRLFPLGRQIQTDEVRYIYEGSRFPCLADCPEVAYLPHMTVGDYLVDQQTKKFETAHDEYLALMQNLADIAFVLLLDSGLSESGDTQTLAFWRLMGNEPPEDLCTRIGQEWIDYLMLPLINDDLNNPVSFIHKHSDFLQLKAQQKIEGLQLNHEFREVSVLIMGVALHLARGLGANPQILAEHWVETAKSHGAME